jgi:hypothetical protein
MTIHTYYFPKAYIWYNLLNQFFVVNLFRYMSDGELLDPVTSSPDSSLQVSGPVMSSGHLADSPHRSYYIWKEPPRQQGPPQGKNGKQLTSHMSLEGL